MHNIHAVLISQNIYVPKYYTLTIFQCVVMGDLCFPEYSEVYIPFLLNKGQVYPLVQTRHPAGNAGGVSAC